ncbi:MAG TPA: hypothetical protein VF092_06350 [Longimicrobium sp.]
MRLDLIQLKVESFSVFPEEDTSFLMAANSQAPCGASTSPCLNSEKTCGPECIAVAPNQY